MIVRFAKRMITEVDPRLLWKFSYTLGWKGMRAVQKFEKRMKRGEFFPAFLFISVTNRCNLSCKGCWSTQTNPPRDLDIATLDNMIEGCKKKGSYFFGILGGEPLLHKGLFDLFERHPDCYFLLFTNGQLLTGEIAEKMRRAGNVSPLISIEGLREVSDERRGGTDVYAKALDALDQCHKHKLVTGVCTSVCQSNIDELATQEFVDDLIARGVHYLWYYIYRPVGPDPSPELALSPDQILDLRRFMVDIRPKTPMMIVDAYWDHEGNALCPAAVGISHHISPAGDVEPCPPIQFACDNVGDGTNLDALFRDSKFLADFRSIVAERTRGCILLEDPGALGKIVRQSGAYDSSGRDKALDELNSMTVVGSHHQPGRTIPEKSFMYKFAKKHWFFGFGAYG